MSFAEPNSKQPDIHGALLGNMHTWYRIQLACRQTPVWNTQLPRTQSVRHPLPNPVQNEGGGKCIRRGGNDRRETVLASSTWESALTEEGGRSTLQTTCLAGGFWTIDFYFALIGSRYHVHANSPCVGTSYLIFDQCDRWPTGTFLATLLFEVANPREQQHPGIKRVCLVARQGK